MTELAQNLLREIQRDTTKRKPKTLFPQKTVLESRDDVTRELTIISVPEFAGVAAIQAALQAAAVLLLPLLVVVVVVVVVVAVVVVVVVVFTNVQA